jgi:Leucine-rich repeat (LRR) protein
MAAIKEIERSSVLAIKALPATPGKCVVGYVQYITEAYNFINKNYHIDINLAERDLHPNLKVFERQEEAIRIVFNRVFRQAHGDVVVNGPNKFNEYLRAKQMIKDQDLISIANRIARDHQNLARGLNPILQMHDAPIDVKANQLRIFINNPVNRHLIARVRNLDLTNLNLRTIPEELKLFIGLERLALTHNQIRELPANFLNNANALTELALYNNQISELPANFLNNANDLRALDLQNNQISELPANFLNNANDLRNFNLSRNQLKYQEHMYFHRIPLVQNEYKIRLSILEHNKLSILEHFKFFRFFIFGW